MLVYTMMIAIVFNVHRWPAMVEEDPDDETYYDLGKWSTSSVPVRQYEILNSICVMRYIFQVKYHVVFFDTPVSRGWVSSFHIQPYTKDTNHNNTTGVSLYPPPPLSLTQPLSPSLTK